MAVFTSISETDAQALLTHYTLGRLVKLQGIRAGIENTNYFLDTENGPNSGRYVLTLFEVLGHAQLPFYIELMHHLAQRGLPVPEPQTRKDGARLGSLHGKPCSIVTCLPGRSESQPSSQHCALAAATLAQMHLAAKDFPLQQPNLRSLPWWQQTIPQILPFLSTEQAALIQDELAAQTAFYASDLYGCLPRGASHCDLFRDNALFDGTREAPRLGGFIDFYFAGWDAWLFDVAVTVNDWCIVHETAAFEPQLLQSWLHAYAAVRPFTGQEREAWGMMLRGAALRFWTSRLYDLHLPRDAQTLQAHDPTHFERLLRLRREVQAPALP